MTVQTKTCDHCTATIVRPAERSEADWQARRYCNHTCARAARRAGPRPTKTCAGCREEFPQPPRTSAAEFARQKHCSLDCYLAHRRHHSNALTKTCEQCGNTFTRRATEGSYRFRGRRTCGRSCGQLLHAAEHRPAPETKTCVVCQAVFTRSKTGTRAKWLLRKYCGVGCANTVRTGPSKPTSARRRKPKPAPKPTPPPTPPPTLVPTTTAERPEWPDWRGSPGWPLRRAS